MALEPVKGVNASLVKLDLVLERILSEEKVVGQASKSIECTAKLNLLA